MRVGFIGLGKMGMPMARNLMKAGFALTVHNRSPGAVDALAAEGAQGAATPGEVCSHADTILTCLPNVAAVEEVYLREGGLIAAAQPGTLLIDHSTVSPKMSRRLYEAARSRGVAFLDAPVSGGTAGAQAGTLTIMAGGNPDAFARAKPVLEAMGKKVYHVGPSGSGTVVKLANQLLVGIHSAAAAEALVLATKAGADPAIVLEVISASFGASAILGRNGAMALEGRFDGGTPIDLILKDLRLIADTADEASVRLPMGSLARQVFEEASVAGLGSKDMSALVLPLERLAGVQVRRREG